MLNNLVGYYRLQKNAMNPLIALPVGITDEKVIDAQIRQLQADMQHQQAVVNENPIESTKPGASGLNSAAQSQYDSDWKLCQTLRGQEKLIETYNNQTSGYYSDAQELCSLVQQGINYIKSLKLNKGAWVSSSDDSAWVTQLNNAIDHSDTKLEQAEEAAATGDIMILSPDGKTIFYQGQPWPVYDPYNDYDLQVSMRISSPRI